MSGFDVRLACAGSAVHYSRVHTQFRISSAQRRQLACAVVAITASVARMSAQSAPSLIGTWRIERGVIAPWVKKSDQSPDRQALLGQTVHVTVANFDGGQLARCAKPSMKVTHFSADALFQGDLPVPAKTIARDALGLHPFPVAGISLNCDAGLFEFHRADSQTMVVALNNVIWTLTRAPGATALATSPSGILQRFLEAHFAGDMGFDSASVAPKREYFTKALRTRITAYFAKPSSRDEVSAIDGDPFTDTQEYPTRFAVGAASIKSGRATVTVKFADGYRVRPVTYEFRRDHGAWLIDEITYTNGESFVAMLR